MLLLLGSGDLLSLFIGWELVSWASFLLMAQGGGDSTRAALRYLAYAMVGAMAMLGGIVLLYSVAGSFQYAAVIAAAPHLSQAQLWWLLLLLGGGFATKLGLLPLHLWQAEGYALAPAPGAAFLGAISSRMGLYALIVVLVQLLGLARLDTLTIPYTFLTSRELWAWIAVITIILPTYTALKQNDARMLLAWHGIGQGGYMLLGLMTANAMGSAGGLLHVFNYATNQAALLLAVFAVMYRTGTTDLNRLGGLVTRMPLTFLVLLTGIIGLAGIPPMNGFVSKWLVYRALVTEASPLLFVAAVIGTLGTILSVYKLIHNIFLGQLRAEHLEVREVPWSMLAPMLLLAGVIFITGFMPGLVLAWVAAAQQAVGLPVQAYTLGGVESAQGNLNMILLVSVLFAGFGVGALLFYSGGKSKPVHQLDNYAGGHFLSASVQYQYSDHFYAGLMHLIGPWYRNSFTRAEQALAAAIDLSAGAASGFYRLAQPNLMLLIGTVFLLAWVLL
jgi:NADH-quinone oxidoreductase subunit M